MAFFIRNMVLAALLTAFVLTGCTRKIYVPLAHSERDTVMETRHRIDTLLMRDSIMLDLRGDTVLKEVYRWRWRTKTRIDSVYKTKTDTVTVFVGEPKAPLTLGQRVRNKAAEWFAAILTGMLAALILRRIFKK